MDSMHLFNVSVAETCMLCFHTDEVSLVPTPSDM